MKGEILRFGRWGVYLTIPGIILTWFIAVLFKPNDAMKNVSNKIEGSWLTTTDSGFKKLEIKGSGYFYFTEVQQSGKSFLHKGIITDEVKDSIIVISFNNDTLLFHKIIALDKHNLQLAGIRDSVVVNFKKEQ